MAQVVIHTTRFSALADLASAYTLAFILKLYQPSPPFATFIADPIAAQAIDVVIIGSFISSFLLTVDPVNKSVRIILGKLLTRDRAPKKSWATNTLASLNIPVIEDKLRESYYLVKARAAYYTPYLAKLRAQITAGTVFSATMLLIIPQARSATTSLILLFLAVVTGASILKDVWWKVPAYSWIVAVYELMVEFKPRTEIANLGIITRHLSEGNWEEAQSWLQYELANAASAKKRDPQKYQEN